MARKTFAARSLLWPSLIAMVFASFYVVTQPGQLFGDAYEYDTLAKSILHGRYELAEEFTPNVAQPTMHREPGYPAFRALVYAVVGIHPPVILWLQVLLLAGALAFAARTAGRIDPRYELPVAWLTAIYPGYVVWAGQHYSESLASFLVALVGWLFFLTIRPREKTRPVLVACLLGLVLGCLILTKAGFLFLPILLAAVIAWRGKAKQHVLHAVIVLAIAAISIAPWIIRNGRTFGEYHITYRTGIGLYTRALKAIEPWDRLWASYGSVVIGEATVLRFFPGHEPIVIQLWQRTWDEKNALLRAGSRYYQADDELLRRAKLIIAESPSIAARFALWTGVDELRLFSLTSPLSPKFGVELIGNQEAREGRLSVATLFVVWAAQLLQLAWWFLLAFGAWRLLRRGQFDHPSLLFIAYLAATHAPFDLIPRYSVPVLPWMIGLIVAALLRPDSSNGGAPIRSTDRRLIEAANIAYHEAEAELYDVSHPEILWCERPHWEQFAQRFLPHGHQPVSILDIGAGTGFVGSVLAAHAAPGDRYVATDISQDMLEKLRVNLTGSSFSVETFVVPADHLSVPERSFDILVVNSALHHFPDVSAALREAARAVRPGGILAIMHEPNIRFARSALFRQVARAASVLASRIDPRASGAATPDYAPVFEHVNRR
ncbi:MAG TPA: class I SAM-dependent methyltransferase, partial [Candidatus Methylomirabilis sp.]|nr:class I SAM-dependent methyltransferase [Candidatus Methylomirabilis sp.]